MERIDRKRPELVVIETPATEAISFCWMALCAESFRTEKSEATAS